MFEWSGIGRPIVEMVFGSHLYGTATPASDIDRKAVFIPRARDILLQRAPKAHVIHRAKAEGEKNAPGEADGEAYALHHYMRLLSEGQTVALDMLFAPDSALLSSSTEWEDIRRAAPSLVCRKAGAFLGYCRQQANKYGIRGSRAAAAKWAAERLAAVVAEHGTTAKLGDVIGDIPAIEHVEVIQIPTPDGERTIPHLSVCGRKAPFTGSAKMAHRTFEGLWREYGERALAAARNENVDWKALSHAVRVGTQALELLGTGRVTFPRPDAERLTAIKVGAVPYDVVSKEIEGLLAEVEAAAERSALPDTVDAARVERLIADAYSGAVLRAA
jgi:hypothetical protein